MSRPTSQGAKQGTVGRQFDGCDMCDRLHAAGEQLGEATRQGGACGGSGHVSHIGFAEVHHPIARLCASRSTPGPSNKSDSAATQIRHSGRQTLLVMLLQELAHQLWPRYLQPVLDGTAAITEHSKLMRGLGPHLQALEDGPASASTSAHRHAQL